MVSEHIVSTVIRFRQLADTARQAGIELGRLHAASSHGLFLRPDAFLDMVRPGLALYGAYPSGADTDAAQLTPAFRLRARVARGKRTFLDEYGATNEAEFFAVATEFFFAKPAAMRRHEPELYELLQGFYGQDPAARAARSGEGP